MSAISESDQSYYTQQSMASVAVTRGQMRVDIIKPTSYGPYPVVVLLMGMFGVNQSLCSIARLIAERGFAVVIPDLYHAIPNACTTANASYSFASASTGLSATGNASTDDASTDSGPPQTSTSLLASSFCPANFDEALETMYLISEERCLGDIESLLDFIALRRDLDAANTAVMGVCMGGRYSLLAGCQFASRINCVSSYYGSAMESCVPELSALALPTQVVIAGRSLFTNRASIRQLNNSLAAQNQFFELLEYEQADHDFLDAAATSFDPVLAAQSLQQTYEFISSYCYARATWQ